MGARVGPAGNRELTKRLLHGSPHAASTAMSSVSGGDLDVQPRTEAFEAGAGGCQLQPG